jgi:hypothetical protein
LAITLDHIPALGILRTITRLQRVPVKQFCRDAQAVPIFFQIALASVQRQLMTLTATLCGTQFFRRDFKALLFGTRDDVDHPSDGIRTIKRGGSI